ncbi:MAG: four helix bundle protein, partial [Muribaculaceae bacterium]
MDTFSFENLNAYKESKSLVVEVYRLIAKFPQSERFALSAQLQRAIVSVPSNIAEGSGRVSYKEKIHFLEI